MYPSPTAFIVTLVIFLFVNTTVAVALFPSPDITIPGTDVYSPPPSTTSIEVIPPVVSAVAIYFPAHLSVLTITPPT